jgi:anti-anti-sigma factor
VIFDPGKAVAMIIPLQDSMRMSISSSSDGSVSFVRILGDVDLSDCAQLDLAARQLHDGPATGIYVDLAGTTFVGSTLLGFLVRVANDGHERRTLVLCRPTAAARRIIHLTGLDELAYVQSELPSSWPGDRPALDPAHPSLERSAST